LELAALTRHPAYDTFYLVLAKRNNAVLLTLDKSLMALAAQAGVSTA
jgi:predicted nucleic acid-binding protein